MSDYPQRYFVLIPFSKKDILKQAYNLRWDDGKRMWYTEKLKTYTNKLSDYHIYPLTITYRNKDKAKLLGAKWDGSQWVTNKKNYEDHLDEFESLSTDTVVDDTSSDEEA